MNKYGLYLAALLISLLVLSRASSQGVKTTNIDQAGTVIIGGNEPARTDTVRIPVPLFEAYDSIPTVIYYHDGKSEIGWKVFRGFKQQTPKGMQYVREPVFHVALGRKKQPIDLKRVHAFCP